MLLNILKRFRKQSKRSLGIALLLQFYFGNAISQHYSVHTETVGNYSGIFFARETKSGSGMKLDQTIIPIVWMFPSRSFSVGIESYYIHQSLTITEYGNNHKLPHAGWGDSFLVFKYNFDIYKKFISASRESLFKSNLAWIAKLKLPTGRTDLKDESGNKLPEHFQMGTPNLGFQSGLIFLTETERYFKIHGHLIYGISDLTNQITEGQFLNYDLTFLFARLVFLNRFLPFIEFKGLTLNENFLFTSIGFQSLWIFVQPIQLFLSLESGFQLPVIQSTRINPLKYDYSFYVGIRLFQRI